MKETISKLFYCALRDRPISADRPVWQRDVDTPTITYVDTIRQAGYLKITFQGCIWKEVGRSVTIPHSFLHIYRHTCRLQ